jgi:hypothetical protein
MTFSFADLPTASLTVQEFIAYVADSEAFWEVSRGRYEPEHMRELSGKLAALGSNLQNVTEPICRELLDPLQFQASNDVQPPTYSIYRDERLAVRLVVWLAEGPHTNPRSFSYYEPHDHNFDFFTTNIFGPGYKTRLFSYRYDRVKGVSAEEVKLNYAGDTILSSGKVMFYQKSKDVHIQFPPDKLSVSLNLIVQPGPHPNRQYEFDIEGEPPHVKAKLISRNMDRFSIQRKLFKALMSAGRADSKALLLRVAQTPRSRRDQGDCLLESHPILL